ncbi:MAG: hypothetical protein AB7O73_13755 [Bacteroidia bacterium]
MFNLGYSKIRNKRRYGERGPKKRYAVFRAELNKKREKDCEKFSKILCEKHGLNLDDLYIDDPKFPWRQTYEHIKITIKSYPYHKNIFVKRFLSDERLKITFE